MAEIRRFAMRCVELRYFCDCGGQMISTGMGRTRLETDWLHQCGSCEKKEWLDTTYPTIVHEEFKKTEDPLMHWTPDHTVSKSACGKVVGIGGSQLHINNPDPCGPINVTCPDCASAMLTAWRKRSDAPQG